MPAPKAGNTVRASNYPKVMVVTKAAVESLTSSTTLQNDDDITIALDANKTYKVVLHLAFTGATAGDIKTQWAFTGGVAQKTLRACTGPEAGTTTTAVTQMITRYANVATASVAYGTDGGSAWGHAVEEFLVETTTAGTTGMLTLQWAQNASSATATNVTVGTWMEVVEVDLG